jgi:hypothetical protein
MAIDPGFMTDSTGEGMPGATDNTLSTQQNLKNTYYNGSKPCLECGLQLTPYEVLYSELCPTCSNRKSTKLVKNRMVSE